MLTVQTTLCTAVAYFLLILQLASASSVLFEMDNAHATVYYDLTDQLCGGGVPFKDNWGEISNINNGIPKCEQWAGATAKTLKQIGTNRIAAIDNGMVDADAAKWCGKEVVIFDSAGQKFEFAEGPLYIWDGCGICGKTIVDLSAKAFTQLKGGTCAGNNPGGLRVQVLDNNIVQPILKAGATPSAPEASSSTSALLAPPLSPSIATASTPSVNSPVTPTGAATEATVATGPPAKAQPDTTVDHAQGLRTHFASTTQSTTTGDNDGVAPTRQPEPTQTAGPGSTPSEDTTAGCEHGKWGCDGLDLRVCTYVTRELGWLKIETCDSRCEITPSGSVDCR